MPCIVAELIHILFETALEDRWQAAVALVGVDPNQLSDYAGHA
jgi:putative transcriptional regulator